MDQPAAHRLKGYAVTESALREVVGTTMLDVLVTGRRDEIASRTREVLQATIDIYGAGITVTSISLETVNYPQAVQAAVTRPCRRIARRSAGAPLSAVPESV